MAAAADLDEEIKRRQAGDYFMGEEGLDVPPDDSADQKDNQPQVQTFDDYSGPVSDPEREQKAAEETIAGLQATEAAAPAVYPRIAEDQTGAPVYPTVAQDQTGAPPSAVYPQIAQDQTGAPVYSTVAQDQTGAPVYPTIAQDQTGAPVYPTIAQDQTGAQVEPAPDTLQQVERGELVSLPSTVEPAPGTLTQVERAQPVTYPQIAEDQGAPGTPPQVQRAQPVVQPAVTGDLAQGPPGTRPAGTKDEPYWPKTVDQISQLPGGVDYIDPRDGSQKTTPGTPPKVQRAQPVTYPKIAEDQGAPGAPLQVQRALPVPQNVPRGIIQPVASYKNPDGTALPPRVQAVGDKDPAAFIVHHTSGRGTVDGVISTLNERGLGVEYVMDRNGNIFNTGNAGAANILPGWGKGAGLNNKNIVGMEVIAKDDQDITPAQAASFARFIAARYPNTPIFGHGEVNPGHKEADEGYTTKTAALALRARLAQGGDGGAVTAADTGAEPREPAQRATAAGRGGVQTFDDYVEAPPATTATTGAVQRAQPADKLSSGFYKDEDQKSFVTGNATTFGGDDDRARYAQAKAAGLSDADARQVGDNGQGAAKLGGLYTPNTYGVAVPREALVAALGNNPAAWRKARIDVINLTTGQRARLPPVDIGPGPGALEKGVAADFTPLTAKLMGTDGRFAFKIVPNAGPDVNKNPDLWGSEQSAIAQGIDTSTIGRTGAPPASAVASRPVSDAELTDIGKRQQQLRATQADLVTKLPEATSENALKLYQRLNDPVDGVSPAFAQQFQQNLKPQIIQAMRQKFPELKTDDDAWAKAMSTPNALDIGQEWINKALGYGQQFTTVMQKGVAGSDQLHVNQFIDSVMPNASDQDKHAYLTKLYAMPAGQRIQEVASKLPQPQAGIPSSDPQQIVSALDRLSDPNFQKKQAAEIANAKAEMERNISDDPRLKGTFMEKIVDATAQMPAYIAAFSNPVMAPVAMAQVADQVREGFSKEHPEWDQKTLEENTARATITQFLGQEAANALLLHGAGAITSGIESPVKRAIAQVAVSMVGQPAIAAGTQAVTNIATGEPAGKGVGEAAVTGAIQGVIPGALHAVGELRSRPPEKVAPLITPVEPPPERPPPPQPITRAEVLGSSAAEATPPWYEAHGLEGQGPIVTRYAPERAFSPQELAARVEQIQRQGGTPEQISQAMENLRPATQEVRFQQPEIPPAPPITQEDVARRTYEINQERIQNGQPGSPLNDWTQAQRELSQAAASGQPTPVTQGESEPWVSAIANRHTAQRTASGQLGDVIPGEGYSKEELLSKGLQMGPEEINQHVSDLLNNRGGDPKLQAAAVRAEEARLSQRSNAASRASEADPSNPQLRTDADNAFNDLTDFHNGPVATLKNNWHAQGMTLQGEIPVDLSTFNGMREKFLRDVGKPPDANTEPTLRKVAQRVRDTTIADNQAMKNLSAEIERQTAGVRLPTVDEVRARIMERMKVDPCSY